MKKLQIVFITLFFVLLLLPIAFFNWEENDGVRDLTTDSSPTIRLEKIVRLGQTLPLSWKATFRIESVFVMK